MNLKTPIDRDTALAYETGGDGRKSARDHGRPAGPDTLASQLRAAAVLLALFTLITGLLYPLLVTGLAAVMFPARAGGSIVIDKKGEPVGSELIGQAFDGPQYFWSRPSATSPVPYTAFNAEKLTGSSGSNLGPTNPALLDAVRSRIQVLKDADPGNDAPVPADLVTASGSGLDPHISVAAANYQAARVAAARPMPLTEVQALIQRYTEGRTYGVLGEARVNVLKLNLALDGRIDPAPTTRPEKTPVGTRWPMSTYR